jgi:MFS family permease
MEAQQGEGRRMSRSIFPGWWVVGGTFFILMIGFGIAYAFAALFVPLSTEFSATRAETSLVFSIAALLYFSLGFPAGHVADRIGPRNVIAAGLAVVATGLLVASFATTLWQVYLGYGIGVGVGVGMAYVPSVAAVQRWFVRQRGLATGIAISGIGIGTLAGAPLCSWLLDMLSWRQVYLVLAGLAVLSLLVALLTMRSAPQAYGLAPDGDPPSPASAAKAAAQAGSSFAEAVRSRPYWLLYIASMLLSFGLFLPFVHLAPYARDIGLGEDWGIFLIMLIGVGSTVGRFAFASVAGALGRRLALAGMFAGAGAMLLLWASSSHPVALVIFAVLFGAFYGGFVATVPSLTADYFGPRSLGSIIGALYTCVALGSFIGPPVAGWAFDLSGSYVAVILTGAALSFAGMALVLLCPEPSAWVARNGDRQELKPGTIPSAAVRR